MKNQINVALMAAHCTANGCVFCFCKQSDTTIRDTLVSSTHVSFDAREIKALYLNFEVIEEAARSHCLYFYDCSGFLQSNLFILYVTRALEEKNSTWQQSKCVFQGIFSHFGKYAQICFWVMLLRFRWEDWYFTVNMRLLAAAGLLKFM